VATDRIVLRNVGLSYGRRGRDPLEALRGIDLDIRDGERFAVVVPPGYGESSLLLLLVSGVLQPTAAALAVRGRKRAAALEVTGYDAARREGRWVPDHGLNLPGLTISTNEKTLKERPKVVQAFVSARMRGREGPSRTTRPPWTCWS
jgi:ABC-type lipoprotein export system ATPase subunit